MDDDLLLRMSKKIAQLTKVLTFSKVAGYEAATLACRG
jgi:hypothetical protein